MSASHELSIAGRGSRPSTPSVSGKRLTARCLGRPLFQRERRPRRRSRSRTAPAFRQVLGAALPGLMPIASSPASATTAPSRGRRARAARAREVRKPLDEERSRSAGDSTPEDPMSGNGCSFTTRQQSARTIASYTSSASSPYVRPIDERGGWMASHRSRAARPISPLRWDSLARGSRRGRRDSEAPRTISRVLPRARIAEGGLLAARAAVPGVLRVRRRRSRR